MNREGIDDSCVILLSSDTTTHTKMQPIKNSTLFTGLVYSFSTSQSYLQRNSVLNVHQTGMARSGYTSFHYVSKQLTN